MKNNRLKDLFFTPIICVGAWGVMVWGVTDYVQATHERNKATQADIQAIADDEAVKRAKLEEQKKTADIAAKNAIPLYNTFKDLSYQLNAYRPPSKNAIDAVEWKDKQVGFRDKNGKCVGYVENGVLYVADKGEWLPKDWIKESEKACDWLKEGTQ